MSKKYTAKEITETLVNLSNALASQTPQFPGLIPVIRAMTEAAKNPTKSFENTKAEAPKVKPVSISYEGESLLVRNTPYSDYKLRQELAAFVGVETKKVNPDTNKPYWKSVWDKKAKAFRIPASAKEAVVGLLTERGLAIKEAA